MFDSIGRDLDEEANKRSAISVAITIALIGAGSLGFMAATALVVKKMAPEAYDEMVQIFTEEQVEDELEAPPPPPPPPPSAAPEEEDDEQEPDEMVEEIKELDEKIDKEIKAKKEPAGPKGGMEGGVIGGVEGGVVGGTLGGPKMFHHSQLTAKKKIQPIYPSAAETLNLGDQRCQARVFIDETGRVYDVQVNKCPKVFHTATQSALMQWRYYPPKSGKEKVKAQILIGVTFKKP